MTGWIIALVAVVCLVAWHARRRRRAAMLLTPAELGQILDAVRPRVMRTVHRPERKFGPASSPPETDEEHDP